MIINCTAWATIQARCPGDGTVHGEVYRIDASTLAELDALRTKGGEYARHLIQTPYGSAWMYVYPAPR
ncbi:AIG2 family protein [Klebsiella michiganensis]|uniref:AIG2 family protein n=1 Tax=Klebsiella michiganensis TaxID=1134687 RepID=A0A7H4PQS4_9ENTR|nr:AIG2 family protein [Klebsiella michiganensis]